MGTKPMCRELLPPNPLNPTREIISAGEGAEGVGDGAEVDRDVLSRMGDILDNGRNYKNRCAAR